MEHARDEARAAYLAPLRASFRELGQVVFGEGFDVELDEDLRVARRILPGEVLAFDELSLGAREQLAVLGRLACALLVSDEGGVPVILDDVLGHSDEARLRAMAELLGRAGERCQVVLLTCHPERADLIPGAKLVTLGV
jgi:uncharacterized protein YhaN